MDYEAREILLEITENIDIEIFNCLVMFDDYDDYLGDHYFHLRDVISKRTDASKNAQEKRILKSLIHYLDAARDYQFFLNTKKKTGTKSTRGIVEHIGFQEIKSKHEYVLERLNEGLNCLHSQSDAKSTDLFKSMMGRISRKFESYKEINNQLLNAEIRDKLKEEKLKTNNIINTIFYIFYIPFILIKVLIIGISGFIIGSMFAIIPVILAAIFYPEIPTGAIFGICGTIGFIILVCLYLIDGIKDDFER